MKRRHFIQSGMLAPAGFMTGQQVINSNPTYTDLDEILKEPVLKRSYFPDKIEIATVELLRYEDNFLCRVRSVDGAEGISVGNNMQLKYLYPIFVGRIQPFFIGKDARDLEQLLEEVYVYRSNYKLQNLAFWVPLATLEFAILDLLGHIAQKPLGDLIGTVHHPSIAVYQANNFRGKTAEESIELIKRQTEKTQAQALKFKVGGRMSNNRDDPPNRTDQLIPLVRKTFGDDMVIYADSNGSYDVKEAVRVGKMMEQYAFDFYEEPVPFDWYHETKEVCDQLQVPIAGGEQEPSLRNFRWMIGEDALDIVQPDIFYFGGMIRSTKVARMAAVRDKVCVPHISGSGLGYLYMMHFVSTLSNAGPYHEFKGFNTKLPLECATSKLQSVNGKVQVPTGPGTGIKLEPSFVDKHKIVKL